MSAWRIGLGSSRSSCGPHLLRLSGIISDERSHLFHCRNRQALAIAQAPDKFPVIDGKAPKCALGHLEARLRKEVFDLGKQRICGHGALGNGLLPICQWAIAQVTATVLVGNVPSMESKWRDRLQDAIARKGFNMKTLSKQAGLGDTYVRDLLVRDREPSLANAMKICAELGVSMTEIFGSKWNSSNEDNQKLHSLTSRKEGVGSTGPQMLNMEQWPRDLRILGLAECGPDGWSHMNGEVIGMTSRPPNLAGAPQAYAIYVVGDSMEPRYHSGEMAYISPGRPVTPGAYVLVQLRPADGDPAPRAILKRLVRRSASKVTLEQFQPAKLIEIKTSEVVSMHRVVGSGEG